MFEILKDMYKFTNFEDIMRYFWNIQGTLLPLLVGAHDRDFGKYTRHAKLVNQLEPPEIAKLVVKKAGGWFDIQAQC